MCDGLESNANGSGMKNKARNNVEAKTSGGVRRSGGDTDNLGYGGIYVAEIIDR